MWKQATADLSCGACQDFVAVFTLGRVTFSITAVSSSPADSFDTKASAFPPLRKPFRMARASESQRASRRIIAPQSSRKVPQYPTSDLQDPSKEVRFWCALLTRRNRPRCAGGLRKLAKVDHRIVKGWWSVSREANWAIRTMRKNVRSRGRRRRRLY